MPKRPTPMTHLVDASSPPPIHSVAFVSLGCPKNLVDSEKMLGLLAEDGIAITADHDQADAIVINTCGFLEASKTESLQVIRNAIAAKRRAHKSGAEKRIIVAGCLVQRHKEHLLEITPDIDALVGVFDRQHIVDAVRGEKPSEPRPSASDPQSDLGAYHPVSTFIHKPTKADIGQGYRESDRARFRITPQHYAYLRISEGCNQGCTFCTIPSIRGRMRSKPLPDILAEAEELFADGAVELNLIGQDTTSYGTDIGYTAAGEGLPGLLRALNKLAAKNSSLITHHSSLPWLRLMYAYPSCFTDDMIKTLADCQHFVKYIDMPLQHINDHILQAMRRKVTRKQTETLLDKLRRWIPGIALRTTLITGFPGETDAQHAELLQFVHDFQFDNLGVFEFSPEPSTPAARLHDSDPISHKIAHARKKELMLAQQKIAFQKNAALVGTTLQVLVDSLLPKSKTGAAAIARLPGQAPDIDGRVYLNHAPNLAPGQLLTVKIDAYKHYDLLATPLAVSATPTIKVEKHKSGAANTKKHLSLPVLRTSSSG